MIRRHPADQLGPVPAAIRAPLLAAALAATLALAGAGRAHAVDLAGQLDWSQRVELSLSVSGLLDSVAVQPGQIVRKGEILAGLNPTVFEAGVMEARADIDRLTNEEADAKRELDRANELYARTVSSTTELDVSKLRHARASALLNAAQARVERARRLLDESQVRAPFDAIVLDRLAEPGIATSQCQPTPLLAVARADQILARAQIDAQQAARLKPGAAAEVSVGGQTHAGKVLAIRARPDARYLLEVAIPRSDGLVAGLAATVRLP